MLRIELDRNRCTGLGICESIDPELFEIDDDGRLILLRDTVEDAGRTALAEAVRACPTRALKVVDAP